jgi:SAM-dependent methyltransferase
MRQRFELVQRVDLIKRECRGKKVLHLGCTNYPYTEDAIGKKMLLHFELEKCAAEIYGLDFDQPGIDILQREGSTNLYRADLERLEDVPLSTTFDVIIAGEMIEHLSNPGLFLQGIKRYMHPETRLILTTVNAYCAMRFIIYALRGRGGENEPVHPDHVSYYSYRTLKLMLTRHDFDMPEFYFYDLGHEHKAFVPWYYRWFNQVAVTFSKQLSDGVIAVAKLNGGSKED